MTRLVNEARLRELAEQHAADGADGVYQALYTLRSELAEAFAHAQAVRDLKMKQEVQRLTAVAQRWGKP